MKLTHFVYTRADGKESSRSALVLRDAQKHVSALDLSSLEDEELAAFAIEYDALETLYLNGLEQLKDTFDVRHSYREFVPERMSLSLVEYL